MNNKKPTNIIIIGGVIIAIMVIILIVAIGAKSKNNNTDPNNPTASSDKSLDDLKILLFFPKEGTFGNNLIKALFNIRKFSYVFSIFHLDLLYKFFIIIK